MTSVPRRQVLLTVSIVLAWVACWVLPATAEPTWKVGLAEAKITPERPFWMAGFADRKEPAKAVLQDLWVKAMALEAAEGRIGVVVTADILGVPKNIYDRLCRELKEKCGLARSQLMFAGSHTHSGPVLREMLYDAYPALDDEQLGLIEEYSTRLETTIVATVVKALAARQPVTLWAGEGTAGFAVNRRTNREADLAEMIKKGISPKGPSDYSVPVLVVRAPDGDLTAVVFGYAAHTSAMCLREYPHHYCGDYAGFAMVDLEEVFPDAQAMFFQGCGSDQSAAPRGTLKRCQEMGGELAVSVRKVLDGSMRRLPPELATAFEFVRLDYESPTREHLETTAQKSGCPARWAKRLLGQLDGGKPFTTVYPEYPLQVWRLGEDQLWFTMGGEVAVDYSLKFKDKYGPKTWVAGYTNDVMAYIPSRRVWEEGGYQAGAFYVYGLPAVRWCPDIEDRITACVDRLVKEVQ